MLAAGFGQGYAEGRKNAEELRLKGETLKFQKEYYDALAKESKAKTQLHELSMSFRQRMQQDILGQVAHGAITNNRQGFGGTANRSPTSSGGLKEQLLQSSLSPSEPMPFDVNAPRQPAGSMRSDVGAGQELFRNVDGNTTYQFAPEAFGRQIGERLGVIKPLQETYLPNRQIEHFQTAAAPQGGPVPVDPQSGTVSGDSGPSATAFAPPSAAGIPGTTDLTATTWDYASPIEAALNGLTPTQKAEVRLAMGEGGAHEMGTAMRLAASFKERPLHWVSDAVTGEHIGLDASGKEMVRVGGKKPEKEEKQDKPSVAPIDTETADLSDGRFRTYDAAMSAGVAGDKQALTWAKQANKNVKEVYRVEAAKAVGQNVAELERKKGVAPERTKNYVNREEFIRSGRMVGPRAGQTITEEEARSNVWLPITEREREDLKVLSAARQTNRLLFERAKRLITAKTPEEAANQFLTLHTLAFTGKGQKGGEAATYQNDSEAFSSTTARAVGLERGVLTNADVLRWRKALPTYGDTVYTRDEKEKVFNTVFAIVEQANRRAIAGEDPAAIMADPAYRGPLETWFAKGEDLDRMTRDHIPPDVIQGFLDKKYGKSK